MSTVAPELTAGTWTIDTSHSQIGFSVRHVMVSKVRGRFTDFAGTVVVPEGNVLDSQIDVSVQMASVTTNDDTRDNHLRSGDLFDVEQFPTMDFKSTAIKADGSDYKLLGDLTIHGVTNPVEFDVEFNGVNGDPWGGTRSGFSATGEISRKDFGLEYNIAIETGGVVIGDKIKIELEVEATLG